MSTLARTGHFTHDATAPPAETSVFSLLSLKGRVAIVTGGSRSIGLAASHALAEAGADVAIWYKQNEAAAAKSAEEIARQWGVKCKAYQVDISTSLATVRAGVAAVLADFGGRLDIFVANAGIAWMWGPMLDVPASEAAAAGAGAGGPSVETLYTDVVRTNLDGTVWCARAAGEVWRRQKEEGNVPGFREGSFVATTSMSAHIVNVPQLQAAYNASKAAVVHLCRSLAVEWVGFARANSVSPGYIRTEISDFNSPETRRIWQDKIPMGREGETHELKGVYLYLASDASSYTTGTDIIVDGGYTLP